MITPERKPAGGELSEESKKFNTEVGRMRYVIEQAISHLKNSWILHTDCRRPFHTFKQTITNVIGLFFCHLAT